MKDAQEHLKWLAEAGAYGSTVVPTVVKKTTYGERGYDIFSRLLEDRIIFIGSVINDLVGNLVVAQMLYLQSENKKQDINLYIHSNGGLITFPGGVPLKRGDKIVGAVGVSGSSVENDHLVAEAGLAAME